MSGIYSQREDKELSSSCQCWCIVVCQLKCPFSHNIVPSFSHVDWRGQNVTTTAPTTLAADGGFCRGWASEDHRSLKLHKGTGIGRLKPLENTGKRLREAHYQVDVTLRQAS